MCDFVNFQSLRIEPILYLWGLIAGEGNRTLVSLGKVLPGFGLPSNAEKGQRRFPISSPLVDDDLFQLAALVDDRGFENAVAGHVARGKEFLVADRLGDVAEWRQVPSRMVVFRKLVQLPGFIEF